MILFHAARFYAFQDCNFLEHTAAWTSMGSNLFSCSETHAKLRTVASPAGAAELAAEQLWGASGNAPLLTRRITFGWYRNIARDPFSCCVYQQSRTHNRKPNSSNNHNDNSNHGNHNNDNKNYGSKHLPYFETAAIFRSSSPSASTSLSRNTFYS